jgi:hypothetical protein
MQILWRFLLMPLYGSDFQFFFPSPFLYALLFEIASNKQVVLNRKKRIKMLTAAMALNLFLLLSFVAAWQGLFGHSGKDM